MRTTAIALTLSIVSISAGNLFAQESGAWRKVAETIPLGSKVKVHILEGKRYTGTLTHVDDTSILVRRNTRRPESAITVTCDSVTNLERDRKAESISAKHSRSTNRRGVPVDVRNCASA